MDVDKIAREALIKAGVAPYKTPAIVLFSGGGDPTALLLAMARFFDPAGLSALHLNYGLRGDSSDGDESFCRDFCARIGVARCWTLAIRTTTGSSAAVTQTA